MGSRDLQTQVETADGLDLFLRAHLPERPRASLLFVHGLGEHSGRYEAVFRELADRDLACWGPDLRGHGRSAGVRGHVERFRDYFLDVDAALRFVRTSECRAPVVLVGHSMGGLVALGFVRESPGEFAALVLSSPALSPHPDLRPPAWKALLARSLSTLAPRTAFGTGIDPGLLSRDPAVGRAYEEDPLVVGKVTARWYVEVEKAGRSLRHFTGCRTPTLVLQAGADRLVDPEATRRWTERCEGPVELESEPEAYHELFQEPDVGERLERIERWLEDLGVDGRFGSSPAPPGGPASATGSGGGP